MKKYSLLMKLVVCCAFGLMHSLSYAQGRALTAAQLDAVVKVDLQNCSTETSKLKAGRIDPATIIPTSNARAFPKDRIVKTLNGIWRGRVLGDDKDVSVDYYWIFDVKNSESLIIAQRTGKQTVAEPRDAATAPKLSFLMCAHEGYYPSKDTPQVHEFVKVSSYLADAPRILERSTGLRLKVPPKVPAKAAANVAANVAGKVPPKVSTNVPPRLSELWQGLLAMGYFKKMPAVAFAGGFFKPLQIQSIANAIGPALVSLKWNAEYRGGGATSVKFTPDVPIKGVEYAEFVGTTTSLGDFLVSSPGNGKLWKVEATGGGDYDLGFDKVSFGPLE